MATCEVKSKKIVEVEGVVVNLSLVEARQLVELLDCVRLDGGRVVVVTSRPDLPVGSIDTEVADLIRNSLEAAGVKE